MKKIALNCIILSVFFLYPVISCTEKDNIEPDNKPDVEVQDSVETPDTTKQEDIDLVSITASISRLVITENGWKSTWNENDAFNIFTTEDGSRNENAKWVNHHKFTYNSSSKNEFKGKLSSELASGKTITYHAFYPYSPHFTDPSVYDGNNKDQLVRISHLPGEYITQKGNSNTDHLTELNMPMYAIAKSTGDKLPKLNFKQMCAVFAVEVVNESSQPLTVTDISIEHSMDYLVGDFGIDITYADVMLPTYDVYRYPENASKLTCLKVVDAEPIPVGEKEYFYIPVMANQFWPDTDFTITVNDFIKIKHLSYDYDVVAGKHEKLVVKYQGPPAIELIKPAQDDNINISELQEVDFQWSFPKEADEYVLILSASPDLSNPVRVDINGNNPTFEADFFDHMMHNMDLDPSESGKVYWTVILRGDERVVNISSFNITRKPAVQNQNRIAESITIPVAILIEDPIYPKTGKRLTEMVHPGWGHKWNDPYVQMKEFERDMEASSHGVVQYEVVKIVEADRLFSYYSNSLSLDNKEYMTVDTLVNHHFVKRIVDNISDYDYVGMMQYYGFDKMTDAGEIKEVWVYTHPASGMYESRLIGDGAFWCNSPGIGSTKATNKELCCVMFCNYERTTDLAMHSYAHRVESIMSQVYEKKGGLKGWNYDTRTHAELTNWEKYSAYKVPFKKYKDGYAHIGCCHFPPNGVMDYDYENTSNVKTYADTWLDYPDIREDESVVRTVNRDEWRDAGGYQWGYMKWYFGHLPHFKGLCPRDGHLNNWWHYIVDYNNAIKYESELRSKYIY